MASPYVGEIRCFGFTFAPVGWAFCNGQLMAIAAAVAGVVVTLKAWLCVGIVDWSIVTVGVPPVWPRA